MIYDREDRESCSIVRFQGDLSGSKDQELRKMFVELSGDGHARIAVDMGQVSYLDSAVLGTLVWGMKNLRERGGDFRLFGLQEFVKDIFGITRLDMAFKIFDKESEAVDSYAEGGGS